MMYQGGKTKLATRIASVMQRLPYTTYVEPFVGSAAVAAVMAPTAEAVVLGDAHADVALLWQAASQGWVPPTNLPRDEYESLRDAEPSALRAFAGYPCSFAGKWFGGYATDPRSDRNFAAAGSRSIAKRGAALARASVMVGDYRETVNAAHPGPGVLIYCDPPYADTTAYRAAGAFDSAAFWRNAELWVQMGADVVVSEYTAPEGWQPVWEAERHVSTALNNSAARAVDRLFAMPRTALWL